MQKTLNDFIKNNIEDILKGSVILVNKPLKWTSFDVIKKIKFLLKNHIKDNLKVGHAGTLDPLATGLLIVCTGPKTKEIYKYQNMDKVYEGIMSLGKTTPSYDLETSFDSQQNYNHITLNDIIDTRNIFLGQIEQVPPIYSAIKIKGVRCYKNARNEIGRNSTMISDIPKREVCIKSFEICETKLPDIKFRIQCSKGTYIRSIAHDFGKYLRVGGYLAQLNRLQIGNYMLKNAVDI